MRDAAVAARGLPLRRGPAAVRRAPGWAFFDARTGMAASPIDILVYESALATGNQPERVLSREFVGSTDDWSSAWKLSGR
jgi:hypothetical protein